MKEIRAKINEVANFESTTVKLARLQQLSYTTALAILSVMVGIILIVASVFIPERQIWLSQLARGFGIALIPTGALGVLHGLFLRRSFLLEMKEQLSYSLNQYFVPFDRLTTAGVVDIHEIFPTTDAARVLAQARSISIVQTWIPDIIPMLRAMRTAAERGCRIRILLMNPDSTVASVRAKELGYTAPDATQRNVEANLAELRRFSKLHVVAQNLEVRLYDGLPAAAIHMFDDTIFLGIYWRQIPAIQGPQFEIRATNSFLTETIELHIDTLWDAALPYSLSEENAQVGDTTLTVVDGNQVNRP